MTNYGWTETEDYFIKLVRPEELFDLSTVEYPDPGHRQADVTAVHKLTKQRETYALAYSKGHNLKLLKSRKSSTEPWLERDKADLAKFLIVKA